MPHTIFPRHTVESAPAASQPSMRGTTKHLGYLPAPVAMLATSPHLLDGFLRLSKLFESTTLDAVSREVLIMTVATRNGCGVCVAMHTAKLTSLGAAPAVIAALRDGRPLPDDRLEAMRQFTLEVLATAGAVGEPTLKIFLGYGYSAQNALEVTLGVGTYTMSTLANRLTGAPLDDQLAPFAWPEPHA